MEAIAQDAELEEHTTEELRKMGEALLEECGRAQEEQEKAKEAAENVPVADESKVVRFSLHFERLMVKRFAETFRFGLENLSEPTIQSPDTVNDIIM